MTEEYCNPFYVLQSAREASAVGMLPPLAIFFLFHLTVTIRYESLKMLLPASSLDIIVSSVAIDDFRAFTRITRRVGKKERPL